MITKIIGKKDKKVSKKNALNKINIWFKRHYKTLKIIKRKSSEVIKPKLDGSTIDVSPNRSNASFDL